MLIGMFTGKVVIDTTKIQLFKQITTLNAGSKNLKKL